MSALEIRPVTPARWDDLTSLFGPSGGFSGCWCMWWRLSQRQFARGNAANRAGMRRVVAAGRAPGLLAYRDGKPVGWVSVAPRAEFPRLQRSPTLKPLDDAPAWAIVCFFIDRGARGSGVGTALLRAAVEHARARGARLVEGYPLDPDQPVRASEAYTGVVSMFRAAGFREVARRGKRPIMRRTLRATR